MGISGLQQKEHRQNLMEANWAPRGFPALHCQLLRCINFMLKKSCKIIIVKLLWWLTESNSYELILTLNIWAPANTDPLYTHSTEGQMATS